MLRTAAIQVFLVHIFFIMKETDIANYVDDNTPYISADNIAQLINSVDEASETLLNCFSDKCFKAYVN